MSESFILLSAGEGRDVNGYGPKSLLKFRSKNVLDYQISTIKSFAPNSEIICVIGYESHKIVQSSPDCKLVFNDDYKSFQGTSIISAFEKLSYSNLWIIHGDIIFSKSSLKIPDKTLPHLMYETKKMMHKSKIGVSYRDGKLLNLDYGLFPKWSQIMYLPKTSLENFYYCLSPAKNTYEIVNQFNEREPVSCFENKQASVYEIDEKDII